MRNQVVIFVHPWLIITDVQIVDITIYSKTYH